MPTMTIVVDMPEDRISSLAEDFKAGGQLTRKRDGSMELDVSDRASAAAVIGRLDADGFISCVVTP